MDDRTRCEGWMPRSWRGHVLLLTMTVLGACTVSPSVPPRGDPPGALTAPPAVSLSPVPTQEQSPSSSVTVVSSPTPVTHILPTRMPPLVVPSQGEWETWRSVELPEIVNIRTLAIRTTWDEHCGRGQGASYFLERTSSGLTGKGRFKGGGDPRGTRWCAISTCRMMPPQPLYSSFSRARCSGSRHSSSKLTHRWSEIASTGAIHAHQYQIIQMWRSRWTHRQAHSSSV
jgi:hypothetical protein